MPADPDDLRRRLEEISAELADLAMDRLRDALDGSGPSASAEERRLTRARRAVDKAAALLRDAGDAGAAGDAGDAGDA